MSEEALDEQVEEAVEVTEEPVSSEEPGVENATEEAAEYTPDYSYKVRDEEFQFDEFLQGSVTSKDQEEALRELYTKSRGLEGYKDKLTSREHEYNELMNEAGTYADGFKTLKKYVDIANESGDFREVSNALGLSEEKLLEYAYNLAKEHTLPEDQRALLKENRELSDRLRTVESSVSQHEQIQQDNSVKNLQMAIEDAMKQNPNSMQVYEAMKKVDRDMFQEMHHLGAEMQKGGLNPSVQSVVDNLVNKNNYLLELEELRQNKTNNPAVQADIGQKPTLPTVKGNNTAAVVKEVSSLDDLRKLANIAMAGN